MRPARITGVVMRGPTWTLLIETLPAPRGPRASARSIVATPTVRTAAIPNKIFMTRDPIDGMRPSHPGGPLSDKGAPAAVIGVTIAMIQSVREPRMLAKIVAAER